MCYCEKGVCSGENKLNNMNEMIMGSITDAKHKQNSGHSSHSNNYYGTNMEREERNQYRIWVL